MNRSTARSLCRVCCYLALALLSFSQNVRKAIPKDLLSCVTSCLQPNRLSLGQTMVILTLLSSVLLASSVLAIPRPQGDPSGQPDCVQLCVRVKFEEASEDTSD